MSFGYCTIPQCEEYLLLPEFEFKRLVPRPRGVKTWPVRPIARIMHCDRVPRFGVVDAVPSGEYLHSYVASLQKKWNQDYRRSTIRHAMNNLHSWIFYSASGIYSLKFITYVCKRGVCAFRYLLLLCSLRSFATSLLIQCGNFAFPLTDFHITNTVTDYFTLTLLYKKWV